MTTITKCAICGKEKAEKMPENVCRECRERSVVVNPEYLLKTLERCKSLIEKFAPPTHYAERIERNATLWQLDTCQRGIKLADSGESLFIDELLRWDGSEPIKGYVVWKGKLSPFQYDPEGKNLEVGRDVLQILDECPDCPDCPDCP